MYTNIDNNNFDNENERYNPYHHILLYFFLLIVLIYCYILYINNILSQSKK
jgi:hypothetical protein